MTDSDGGGHPVVHRPPDAALAAALKGRRLLKSPSPSPGPRIVAPASARFPHLNHPGTPARRLAPDDADNDLSQYLPGSAGPSGRSENAPIVDIRCAHNSCDGYFTMAFVDSSSPRFWRMSGSNRQLPHRTPTSTLVRGNGESATQSEAWLRKKLAEREQQVPLSLARSLSLSLSLCSAKPCPLVTQHFARPWPSADVGCGMKVEELSWLAAEFQAKGQRTAERTTDRAAAAASLAHADACINQALLAAASTTPARTEGTARVEAEQPSKALGATDSCGWRSRFHTPLAVLCEIACADSTEGACSPMTARPP